MSALTEFLDRVMRAGVDARPIRTATDLDITDAAEGLEVIQRLSKEEMADLLAAGARSGMDRELLTVLRSFHEIAYRHGDSLKAGSYVGADLITRGGKTLRGQLLQQHLKTWRNSLGPGADQSAKAFLEEMQVLARQDLKDVPYGKRRLITLLKALMGPVFDLTSKAKIRPKVDARPILSLLRLINPDQGKAIIDIADDLTDIAITATTRIDGRDIPSGIASNVNDAFGRIYKLVDDFPDQAGELADVLDEFDDPANVQVIVELTTELFRKYAPDGDLSQLTKADIAKLVGRSKNSADHVFDEIVLAQMMVFRRLKDIETYGNIGMSSGDLFHAFMRVPGSEGFFQTITSRAPHEHAYIFEQLISFNLIAALVRETGTTVGRIVIQAWIGSKAGPDNIVVIIEGGKRIARIIQAKSYKSLKGLIRRARSATDIGDEAALGDAAGDVIDQTWKDLRRTMGSGGRYIDRATGEVMDIDQFDGVLRSKFDFERARLDASNFDSAFDIALRERLARANIVRDTVNGKDVTKASTDELLFSGDPEIIKVVKRALIEPILLSLKTEVAAVPALLAEEVRKLSLAGFEAAYAVPANKADWVARHERLTSLFTQKEVAGLSDEAKIALEIQIRDEFLGYFNAMYRCPNGTLEIEFDLVDLLTDVDVSRGIIRVSD